MPQSEFFPFGGGGPAFVSPASSSMEGLQRAAMLTSPAGRAAVGRKRRIAEFEDRMDQYPGAAPGGTGETGITKSQGVAGGLVTSQHRDWSDLLNQQTQYANDVNAEQGKGPVDVNFGGYGQGAFTGEGGKYGSDPRETLNATVMGEAPSSPFLQSVRERQAATFNPQQARKAAAHAQAQTAQAKAQEPQNAGEYDLAQRAKIRKMMDGIYPEVAEERDFQNFRTRQTQQQLDDDYDLEFRQPQRSRMSGDIRRGEAMRNEQAGADRYFDPDVTAKRESEDRRGLNRVYTSNVLPAEIRSGAQVSAATIGAGAQRDAAAMAAGSRVDTASMNGLMNASRDALAVIYDPNSKPEQVTKATADIAAYQAQADKLRSQGPGIQPSAAVQPTVAEAQGGVTVGSVVEYNGKQYRVTGFDANGDILADEVGPLGDDLVDRGEPRTDGDLIHRPQSERGPRFSPLRR